MNPTFPTRLSAPYTDGQYRIYPNSLLFKSGNYPDKQFSMTPAEIAAAADSFASPVPINLEHAPTVLQGKLGEVRAAYVDPNAPEELRGVVAVPTWLDDQLTDAERQVSSEFNRETKRLIGLALTPTPRVEGAALMAAFNSFSHAEPGEGEADNPAVKDGRKGKPMTLWEELKAAFTKRGIDVDKDAGTPGTDTAAFNALSEKVDKLATAVLSLSEKKTDDPAKPDPTKTTAVFSESDAKAKAAEFATELIAAKKCLPAERAELETNFLAMLRADTAVASFSGDVLLTPATDAFKASHRARPAHLLTAELMADSDPDAVLFAYGKEGKPKGKACMSSSDIMAKHNKKNDACMGGKAGN
jgi:hypothetical protein